MFPWIVLRFVPAVVSLSLPASPSAASSADASGPRWALLDIQAIGLDSDLVTRLNETLAAEVASHARVEVLSGADLNAALSAVQLSDRVRCIDVECLADVGRALGARRVLAATLGRVGRTYAVHLKAVAVSCAHSAQCAHDSVRDIVRGGPDVLLGSLRGSVSSLLRDVSDRTPRRRAEEAPLADRSALARRVAAAASSVGPRRRAAAVAAYGLLGVSAAAVGIGSSCEARARWLHGVYADASRPLGARVRARRDGRRYQSLAHAAWAVAGVAALGGILAWLWPDHSESGHPAAGLVSSSLQPIVRPRRVGVAWHF